MYIIIYVKSSGFAYKTRKNASHDFCFSIKTVLVPFMVNIIKNNKPKVYL